MQNFKDTKEEREKFSAHLAALSSPPQRERPLPSAPRELAKSVGHTGPGLNPASATDFPYGPALVISALPPSVCLSAKWR